MSYLWKRILYCALLLAFQSTIGDCRYNLKLINNRYEGLVVSISEKTPQDHCNGVIHGLKVVLTRFSSLLWEVTEGRSSLGEVTVSLPKSWKTNALTCSLLQPLESASPFLKSHINIRGLHPIFGVDPWTQQSQGCGKQGDFIQLGSDLLRAVSNESHTRTAHKLLKEWTRFRWGIFDESGHEGDSLYPLFYWDSNSKEMRRNQCSGNPRLPFCDEENHIPQAPSKHNALCNGKSAWSIIMQSEDFINERNLHSNSSTIQAPTFRFVQEKSPRFVLAVEDTAVMNMQRRWEFVRKAVRRTVVYDVPDDTQMALVVFNSVAKTVAPLSKIDSISDVRQRIGSSLPRNPSTVPESHKCIMCGIQESLRALGAEAAGANIILVTTGSGTANQYQMNEIVRIVENIGVRITPVVYPLTNEPGSATTSATSNLEPLIMTNGKETGNIFTVIDEGVGNDSKVNMMVSLMDALLEAVRLSGPKDSPKTPILIHSEAYPGGISSMSSGTFRLDESLDKAARFSVYYYDLSHVGNTIQLTTPSGNIMASINMQEEDGDANVIFVNIPVAERGIWKYKVENRADSHQSLHIQVTAKESDTRKLTINLRSSGTNSNSSEHVMLYAEIKERDFPIIGAQVQAKLKPLGSNATGYSYKPFYINLTDNGAGDPDITKGDGVYSRYLPRRHLRPGPYEISIIADYNNGLAMIPTVNTFSNARQVYEEQQSSVCCGNEFTYDHLKPVSPFRREFSYGIITVNALSSHSDTIPPSRILNLQVSVSNESRISMKWTAPGDDFDWGRADTYEAVIATSWLEAAIFKGNSILNLPIPHMASLEQNFSFENSQYEQVLYASLRASDSSNNKGAISNIVSFIIPRPTTLKAPPTTPILVVSPTYSDKILPDSSFELPVEKFEFFAMLSGSILGLLIMLAVILCYCYFSARQRKKQKKHLPAMEQNPSVMIKPKASPGVSRDEVLESVDRLEKKENAFKDIRSLSPVQSWAASRLLAEHERRYSVSNSQGYEQQGQIAEYDNDVQVPYPDVTLSCSQSYPSSQTPSTTNSDPPAYQISYGAEVYPPYPYGVHHQSFTSEELPPYTPHGGCSQASHSYGQEAAMYPTDLSYAIDGSITYNPQILNYAVGDASYANIPRINYDCGAIVNEVSGPYPSANKKQPPPVAPKPHNSISAPLTNAESQSDQKRRNITQV